MVVHPLIDIPMVIIYDNCQIIAPNGWPMYDMNKIKIEAEECSLRIRKESAFLWMT
jgi:hypothetical protein